MEISNIVTDPQSPPSFRIRQSPTESQPSSPTDEFSVRRISSFMLLQTQQLATIPVASTDPQVTRRTWYRYSMLRDGVEFFVNVGHDNRTFSAEDLMGFNNTGNVCIWPSEETLSYYVCSNLHKFRGRRVIELGGGMSCLAGLFVAKYAGAAAVTVSDGNETAVENVRAALGCNQFDLEVECRVVQWSAEVPAVGPYDVVLCADCVFFDEARADLVECLWAHLGRHGTAYVMAPQRGSTLDRFVEQAVARGFACERTVAYSETVWQRRTAMLGNCDYDDDIHYPILLEVTKV